MITPRPVIIILAILLINLPVLAQTDDHVLLIANDLGACIA
jgi:hypothetical protein